MIKKHVPKAFSFFILIFAQDLYPTRVDAISNMLESWKNDHGFNIHTLRVRLDRCGFFFQIENNKSTHSNEYLSFEKARMLFGQAGDLFKEIQRDLCILGGCEHAQEQPCQRQIVPEIPAEEQMPFKDALERSCADPYARLHLKIHHLQKLLLEGMLIMGELSKFLLTHLAMG